MRKYLSEKNALTVVVSLFCLVMMIIALFNKQSFWEAIAFALAFSFPLKYYVIEPEKASKTAILSICK